MKKFLLFVLLFLAPVFAQELQITVRNPAPFSRQNEIVEMNLHELYRSMPALKNKLFEVVDAASKKTICSQMLDYDGNGIADQLIFQSDFSASADKPFTVKVCSEPPVCDTLTDGRFVLPREDYAWENDMIAFRMYGPALAKDVKNGVDVWTKRVPYRIVAKWYKESEGSQPGKDSYHTDKGEGADFFSVGKTLGAGGSAVFQNGVIIQPPVFSRWKTVSTGPIRVCFELWYDSLIIDGKPVRERRRISLDAGSHFNKVEVSYLTDQPTQEKPGFVAGLAKRKNTHPQFDNKRGIVTLWGTVNDDTLNGDLGTALIIPDKFFLKTGEDSSQLLAFGKTLFANSYHYYSGAAWTRRGMIRTEHEWIETAKHFSERIANPMRVILTDSKGVK